MLSGQALARGCLILPTTALATLLYKQRPTRRYTVNSCSCALTSYPNHAKSLRVSGASSPRADLLRGRPLHPTCRARTSLSCLVHCLFRGVEYLKQRTSFDQRNCFALKTQNSLLCARRCLGCRVSFDSGGLQWDVGAGPKLRC